MSGELTWWSAVGNAMSAAGRGDAAPEDALRMLQDGLHLDSALLAVADPAKPRTYVTVVNNDYDPVTAAYLTSQYALACPGYAFAARAGTASRYCDTPFDFRRTRTYEEFLGPAGFEEGVTVPFVSPWTGQRGFLAANSSSSRPISESALVGLTLLSNAMANATVPMLPAVSHLNTDDAALEIDLHGHMKWLRGDSVGAAISDGDLLALARYLRTSRRSRGGFRTKAADGEWRHVQGHLQSAPGTGLKVLVLLSGSVPPAGLTERELDVLSLVCRGMTNGQIAEALYITLSTVKSHIESMLSKLDQDNRSSLVALAAADDLWTIRYFID